MLVFVEAGTASHARYHLSSTSCFRSHPQCTTTTASEPNQSSATKERWAHQVAMMVADAPRGVAGERETLQKNF